jgi:hypothetical protein
MVDQWVGGHKSKICQVKATWKERGEQGHCVEREGIKNNCEHHRL